MGDDELDDDVAAVLGRYGPIGGVQVAPVSIGLINRTLVVQREHSRFVLQRLHPIFGPELHHDIELSLIHI